MERARLFDVYTGSGIPAGKKSLAFSLIYRAADRTLTTEEVDTAHAKWSTRSWALWVESCGGRRDAGGAAEHPARAIVPGRRGRLTHGNARIHKSMCKS